MSSVFALAARTGPGGAGPSPPPDRRAAILEAAAALFAERRDVEAVGVDDIAARAGVAKATLYRYFRSKAAIVEAVAAQRGGEVAAWQQPDRRTQITDAAMRLIPQRGLRATTLEQIAEAAGISPATIYWHFPSKDQLVIALAERCSPLKEVSAVLAGGAEGDPQEDLRRLVRLMLHIMAERLGVIQACLADSWSSPRVAAYVLRHVAHPVWATVGGYFDAQARAGRLERAPALPRVFAFAGPLVAFSIARRVAGFGGDAGADLGGGMTLDVEEMVVAHVDSFLKGAATPAYLAELKRRAAGESGSAGASDASGAPDAPELPETARPAAGARRARKPAGRPVQAGGAGSDRQRSKGASKGGRGNDDGPAR